jgi:hypothetical protein
VVGLVYRVLFRWRVMVGAVIAVLVLAGVVVLISRARRGLLHARAADDTDAIGTWEKKVAAAQRRVDASKDESASPIAGGKPPAAAEGLSAGLETRKAAAATVRQDRMSAAAPSDVQSEPPRVW